MTAVAVIAAPVAMSIALTVDSFAGEPPERWHPVVWIGSLLIRAGDALPREPASAAFASGGFAWLALATLCAATGWLAEQAIGFLAPASDRAGAIAPPVLAGVALGLLLKPCLSWRMLREEVESVEQSLAHRGVDAGRQRIARIAGRDPTTLTALEVRETAIESLAENLNDSVVAPLFWFALAGLSGALLYRFANTADAMWGKRGDWEWRGKWAARADDVLSFVPARLSGLMLVGVSRLRVLPAEARRTESPNGGWPMAAMALYLGIRLGRPGHYVLNASGRDAIPADTTRAVNRARQTLAVTVLLLAALATMREAIP